MVRTGHTQQSLGTAVGISQEAIQKILSGKTKEPKKIFEIAHALGVTVAWLKTGGGIAQSKSEWWKDLFKEPEGKEHIRLYSDQLGGRQISVELLYKAFKARYDWEREHGQ